MNLSSHQSNPIEPDLNQTEPLINLFNPSAGPIDYNFKVFFNFVTFNLCILKQFKAECIQYLKDIKINQAEILTHIRSKKARGISEPRAG